MPTPTIPPRLLQELEGRARELTDLAKIYGKKEKVSLDLLIQHVLTEYVRSYGGHCGSK